MPLSSTGNHAVGAVLGGLTGALSPNLPKYDYKKEGVGFLTGYGPQRNAAFAPYLKQLGKIATTGGQMSALDRAKFSGGELAKLGGQTLAAHQGVNERAIQRGTGTGDGMAEAGHLSVDMAGLDATRGLLGQVAASEAGGRINNQLQAGSMLSSLYQNENNAENQQVMAQFQNRADRTMQGSKLFRAVQGGAQGWAAS